MPPFSPESRCPLPNSARNLVVQASLLICCLVLCNRLIARINGMTPPGRVSPPVFGAQWTVKIAYSLHFFAGVIRCGLLSWRVRSWPLPLLCFGGRTDPPIQCRWRHLRRHGRHWYRASRRKGSTQLVPFCNPDRLQVVLFFGRCGCVVHQCSWA